MPLNFVLKPVVFLTAFAFGVGSTLISVDQTGNQKRIVLTETARGFSAAPANQSNCVAEKLLDDSRDPVGRAVMHTEKYLMLMDKRNRLARKHADRPSSKTEAELLEIDVQLLEIALAYRRLHEAALNGNQEKLLYREVCLEP